MSTNISMELTDGRLTENNKNDVNLQQTEIDSARGTCTNQRHRAN